MAAFFRLRLRRWFRWLRTVLLALFLAGLAAEAFCRLYLGLGDPPLLQTDPQIEYLFQPSKTYHRFGNTISYNAYSMRSDDFPPTKSHPDELRVLVLGDSVVNGGAQTDQKDLATEHLKRDLQVILGRPVVVGNISAGSWGPGNLRAYIEKFGWFDADLAVIVLSSHDYGDHPTFQPWVGVHPDAPDHPPLFALGEAVTRYLPRYLPCARSSHSEPSAPPSPQTIAAVHADFLALVNSARQAGVGVLLAQHYEHSELTGPPHPGHAEIASWAAELNLPTVQLGPAFAEASANGQNPYRDEIHPNTLGQRLIARVLRQAVLGYLHQVPRR